MAMQTEECLSLVLSLVRGVGLWPRLEPPGSWRSLLEKSCCVALMLARVMYVASMLHVYQDWTHTDAILVSTPKFCTAMPVFVLSALVLGRRLEFQRAAAELQALFAELQDSRVTQVSVRQGRQLVKVHFSMVLLTMFMYCSMPLFALATHDNFEDIPFPVDTWFPLERTCYRNFFIEYAWHLFWFTITATSIAALHLLCFSFMLHIGSLYDAVNTLALDCALAGALPHSTSTIHQHLRKITIFHQKVLKLTADVKRLLDPFLFSLLIVSSFSICLMVYDIATMKASNPRMAASICHLVLTVFVIGLFCFFGTRITEKSARVSETAYCMNWLKCPQYLQCFLTITTVRSQKPVYITAGKFAVLSFTTFAGILQAAYSYYAALKNLSQE